MVRGPAPRCLPPSPASRAWASRSCSAYFAPPFGGRDAATLQGFIDLNRPRLTPLLSHVAHLADPAPYGLIGLALVVIALARRPRARGARDRGRADLLRGDDQRRSSRSLSHPRPQEWLGKGRSPRRHGRRATRPPRWRLRCARCLPCRPRCAPRPRPPAACSRSRSPTRSSRSAGTSRRDVIGGFLVAALWTSLAVAAIVQLDRAEPAAHRAGAARPRLRTVLRASSSAPRVAGGPADRRRPPARRGGLRPRAPGLPARRRRRSPRWRRCSPHAASRGYDGPAVAPGSHSGSSPALPRAAEDEEQVREPVEVAHDLGVGVLDEQRAALGAAADGPADVQLRGRRRSRRAARSDFSGSSAGVDLVAGVLEPRRPARARRAGARRSPPWRAPRGRRRRRTGRSGSRRSHAACCSGSPGQRERHADLGVELVDRRRRPRSAGASWAPGSCRRGGSRRRRRASCRCA